MRSKIFNRKSTHRKSFKKVKKIKGGSLQILNNAKHNAFLYLNLNKEYANPVKIDFDCFIHNLYTIFNSPKIISIIKTNQDLVKLYVRNIASVYKIFDESTLNFIESREFIDNIKSFLNPNIIQKRKIQFGGSNDINFKLIAIVLACFIIVITWFFNKSNQKALPPTTKKSKKGKALKSSNPHNTKSKILQVLQNNMPSLPLNVTFNPTFLSFNDNRRKILKVVFTKDNLQCVIKYSNNIDFIDAYKIEKEIYQYFKYKKTHPSSSHKCVYDVVDLLSDDGNTLRNNDNKIEVNIEDYSGRARKIYIPVSTNDSRHFYYLITSFDNNFILLENINDLNLPEDPTKPYSSKNKLNEIQMLEIALPVIINSLGILNASEGFYHGDLKIDNVMISKDLKKCKHFDFDFSGILGGGKLANKTVADVFFRYNYKGVDMYQLLDRSNPKSKNIMFIFDVYRLFWSLYKSRFRSFLIPLGNISCSNYVKRINEGGIKFNLNLINEYFYNEYSTFDFEALIDIIGQKFKIKEKYRDWNTTLFHHTVFLDCCEYILNKNGQSL